MSSLTGRALQGTFVPGNMGVRTIDGVGLQVRQNPLQGLLKANVTAYSAMFLIDEVTTRLDLETLDGRHLESHTLPRIWEKGEAEVSLDVSKLPPERYRLRVAILNINKERIGLSSVTFEKVEELDHNDPTSAFTGVGIALRKFFFMGKIEASVNLEMLGKWRGVTRINLRRAGEEAILETRKIPKAVAAPAIMDAPPRERVRPFATATFDTLKLPPRPYEVDAVVLNDEQQEIAHCNIAFDKVETPSWYRSIRDMNDVVPTPWTPLEGSDGEVRCWGRTYHFKGLPYPNEITTANASILSSPIQLKAVVDGTEETWQPKEATHKETSKSKVTFTSEAYSENLLLEGRTTVEFDGMMKVEITLTPREGRRIDYLALEVPIKEAHARYTHYNDVMWTYMHAPAVIREALALPFLPFIWLGDHDRGLMWFAESDESISVRDESKVIEVVPVRNCESPTVLLRINLIEIPQAVGRPFKMTFGLQATPVKPLKVGNPSNMRYGGIPTFKGMEEKRFWFPERVIYPAKGNVNISKGTLEMWVTPLFDMDKEPEDAPEHHIFTLDGQQWVYARYQIRLRWLPSDKSLLLYYYRSYEYIYILKASTEGWKEREPHHIAATWRDKVTLYVDGHPVASAPHRGLMMRNDYDEEKATLRLGFKNGWVQSPFIVDEFRISDIPREPSDFAISEEVRVDEHTLLLDHFNENFAPNGVMETTAAKISGRSGEKGGLVSDGARFEPGRFGMGIRLVPQTEPKLIWDINRDLGIRCNVCSREFMLEFRRRGIKAIVGALNQYMFQTRSPVSTFKDELGKLPKHPLQYHPHNFLLPACYNTALSDYALEDLRRRLKKDDIDGFYADGTSSPFGCTNEAHGCGYTDPLGKRRSTYPIFALREMMKRTYILFKTKKPDSLLFYHMSAIFATPTLSFADVCYGGEQFYHEKPGFRFDLDKFRVECTPAHWGIVCMYHAVTGPALSADYLLAMVTLHGSMISAGDPEVTFKRTAIWRALDAFGYEEAQWLPYWKNRNLATSSLDDVKVSMYRRKERVMLIVANVDDKTVEATVDLDLGALGLPEDFLAIEGRTGEVFSTSGSKIMVSLKPRDMHMIVLSQKSQNKAEWKQNSFM